MQACCIFPFRRLTLDTSLSPQEVASVLSACVGDRRQLRYGSSDRLPYRGTVSPHKFKILRNLGHCDGWQPVVRGKLESAPFGTRIHVTLRLMFPGYVAAVFLWLATALLAIAIIAAAIGKGQVLGLIVLGVYLVGLALILKSFWNEADMTQRFLLELLPPAQ